MKKYGSKYGYNRKGRGKKHGKRRKGVKPLRKYKMSRGGIKM